MSRGAPAQPLRDDIYDADGDGIEDVEKIIEFERDKYFIPAVFDIVEDMYNTQHGLLPGFQRKREEYKEAEYTDPWDAMYPPQKQAA